MILKPVIMETSDTNGFQSFLNLSFQDGGLHHLDKYCTLIIEA